MTVRLSPLGTLSSLDASEEQVIGDITLVRLETLGVTVRVTYNASATSGVRLKLYFSPDGKNYDTVAYAYFDIDLTAGSTVQETKLVDAPERGHLRVALEDLDATYAATGITVWSSLTVE